MAMFDLYDFDVDETVEQLQTSLRFLERAAMLVSPRWRGRLSPSPRGPHGEEPWGVSTNLAHMAIYEELLAAPVLEALASGRDGVDAAPSGGEDWFSREAGVLADAAPDEILRRLGAARDRQVAALHRFTQESFNEPRTSLWGACWGGLQPAGWVAAKTVQHTWEHGNTIFQIALFAPR